MMKEFLQKVFEKVKYLAEKRSFRHKNGVET